VQYALQYIYIRIRWFTATLEEQCKEQKKPLNNLLASEDKMEQNRDTLNALIEYLCAHGYPASSIAVEFPAGRKRADLAVVDPDTKEVVAVFELKMERNPRSEKFGREQLRTYLQALGNPAVPAYLVFDNPGQTPPFEIERVRPEPCAPDEPESSSVPNFQVLQKSRQSTAVAEKKTEKKTALDKFLIACWVCALITGVLLLIDIFSEFKISQQQLALFGATIALIIIPFASKLKVLGVEFERLRKGNDSE